ncbi:MAG: hypothetical protein ACPGU4_10675 [Flavobacteriales bacterium]
MSKVQERYRCWLFINQNERIREFEAVELETSEVFLKFLEEIHIEKSVELFRFSIYVQPQVNFGLQSDSYAKSTRTIQLSANIDYDSFKQADNVDKVKYVLNAVFTLLEYMALQMTLPNDFDANEVKERFRKFLSKRQFLLSDQKRKEIIIKPFESTRFNFVTTTTREVDEKNICYDLVHLENHINNGLAGQTFGTSIKEFDFGYEIFDFNGEFADFLKQNQGLKRYGHKYKKLLVVKQFDYSKLKELPAKKQFKFLTEEVLQAIADVDLMKRKPKDFDKAKFSDTISKILADYESKKEITNVNKT